MSIYLSQPSKNVLNVPSDELYSMITRLLNNSFLNKLYLYSLSEGSQNRGMLGRKAQPDL